MVSPLQGDIGSQNRIKESHAKRAQMLQVANAHSQQTQPVQFGRFLGSPETGWEEFSD